MLTVGADDRQQVGHKKSPPELSSGGREQHTDGRRRNVLDGNRQSAVSGGAGGNRTRYLFNAIEALSQMSYSPTGRLPEAGKAAGAPLF